MQKARVFFISDCLWLAQGGALATESLLKLLRIEETNHNHKILLITAFEFLDAPRISMEQIPRIKIYLIQKDIYGGGSLGEIDLHLQDRYLTTNMDTMEFDREII